MGLTKKLAPRTLTEALRGFDREQLTLLLKSRPDLGEPVPGDLTELATRATTTVSLARALEHLNAYRRLIAEGLAALPDPSSVDELAELIDHPPYRVSAAVDELRQLALLWGSDDQLHLVRGVRASFEPYPGGLALPSPRPLTVAEIETAIADCDASVRPVLDKLAWSPSGAVRRADRRVDPSSASSPIEQLLAHRLLRPVDSDTVLLAREVAWHIRGGRFAPDPVPADSPPVTGRRRELGPVDRAAAGAAFALLHDIELGLHLLQATPHRLLRTGGLASRDVTSLARSLGTDVGSATFMIECASAARLVATGAAGRLLPTAEYDNWLSRSPARRWQAVLDGWLNLDRLPSRSAENGNHALGLEAEAPGASSIRSLIMILARDAGLGTAVDLTTLAAAASWHRPRLRRSLGEAQRLVEWVWSEAGRLGLAALEAVSSFTIMINTEDPMPERLIDLFPTPIEEIIVQADLTAVAPGPLTSQVAQDLRLLAQQESRGAGGVFRFSADSLRGAYDAGWSSAQIFEWLSRHSTTGIPQPLAYLVEDVARRHGSVRVGTATSYVRLDDPADAAALLRHPSAMAYRLRELAPGVLAAAAEPEELFELLRDLGHRPTVEDDRGRTRTAPAELRARTPAAAPDPFSASAAAELLLAREAASSAADELAQATRDARPVHVAFVSSDGSPSERELRPLELAAGTVRGVDRHSAQVVSIPLSRISAVREIDNRR
jgi:hypothetical protein